MSSVGFLFCTALNPVDSMFDSTWLVLVIGCLFGVAGVEGQNYHVLAPYDWTAQVNRMMLTGQVIAGLDSDEEYLETCDESFVWEVAGLVEPGRRWGEGRCVGSVFRITERKPRCPCHHS